MILNPKLISSERGDRYYKLIDLYQVGAAIRLTFKKEIFWQTTVEYHIAMRASDGGTDFSGGFNKEIVGFTHMRDTRWSEKEFREDYRNKEKFLLRYIIKMAFGDKKDETIPG